MFYGSRQRIASDGIRSELTIACCSGPAPACLMSRAVRPVSPFVSKRVSFAPVFVGFFATISSICAAERLGNESLSQAVRSVLLAMLGGTKRGPSLALFYCSYVNRDHTTTTDQLTPTRRRSPLTFFCVNCSLARLLMYTPSVTGEKALDISISK